MYSVIPQVGPSRLRVFLPLIMPVLDAARRNMSPLRPWKTDLLRERGVMMPAL